MRTSAIICCGLSALAGRAGGADDPTGATGGSVSARAPKVLLIGIDGCRADALHAANAPNLHALMRDGCWSDRSHTGQYTCSGPGWSSVLCGVWAARHNVKDNTFRGAAFDRWPHFFERLKEARPASRVASFVSWLPIDQYITPRDTDVRFAHDCKDGGDELVAEAAASALAREDLDAAFVYFADVDETGHSVGFDVSERRYMDAVELADARVGRVLDAVRSRPEYARENWLVLVTPDHGGTPDGKHGRDIPAHREIFYIASGDDAARGELLDTVNQVDVVTTAMAHLGVAPRAEWRLDGRVRGLASGAKALGVNLVDNGDAEAAEPARSRDVNLGIPGWVDLGGLTTIAYGALSEFPSKDSAGPGNRGRAFFATGDADASMSQTIDLRDFAAEIDAGTIGFEISAWLGGGSTRRDMSRVTIEFVSGAGAALTTAQIAPGSSLGKARRQRAGGDSLLREATRGRVPTGTRSAVVTLSVMAGQAEDDGCADNIELVLRGG